MYQKEDCACGHPHVCQSCVPEDMATDVARQASLDFILVVGHKGHYVKYLAGPPRQEGASPRVVQLWHALLELDSQHF